MQGAEIKGSKGRPACPSSVAKLLQVQQISKVKQQLGNRRHHPRNFA